MAAPTRKPPERRQRRAGSDLIKIQRGEDRIVRIPEPPEGLQDKTVEQWEDYWCSDVSRVIEIDSDLPAVRRLFQLYDERDRAYEAYREERLVPGSQGQPVLNPLAKMMQRLDGEIRQMEDRLGLNPKARLQLGIQLTEATKSLNQLMDGLDPYDEDDAGDGDAKLEAV